MRITEAAAAQPVNTAGVQGRLGQDAFLKLLVTELKYQDPLSPVDNRDLIVQLAEFSSLEKLTSAARSLDFLKGLTLLGREVAAKVGDTTYRGTVERVAASGAETVLFIDGKQLPLSSLESLSVIS